VDVEAGLDVDADEFVVAEPLVGVAPGLDLLRGHLVGLRAHQADAPDHRVPFEERGRADVDDLDAGEARVGRRHLGEELPRFVQFVHPRRVAAGTDAEYRRRAQATRGAAVRPGNTGGVTCRGRTGRAASSAAGRRATSTTRAARGSPA